MGFICCYFQGGLHFKVYSRCLTKYIQCVFIYTYIHKSKEEEEDKVLTKQKKTLKGTPSPIPRNPLQYKGKLLAERKPQRRQHFNPFPNKQLIFLYILKHSCSFPTTRITRQKNSRNLQKYSFLSKW